MNDPTLDTLREDWLWGGCAAPLIEALRALDLHTEASFVLRVSLADPNTPDREALLPRGVELRPDPIFDEHIRQVG